MPGKLIQENFGQAIIDQVHTFAGNDIPNIHDIELKFFNHLKNQQLKIVLSETYFGTRWIYKLGLSLLVKDQKQMAHVRAQIIDYSSICESVLADMIEHKICNNTASGTKFRQKNVLRFGNIINWTNITNKLEYLGKQGFYWLIEVAQDENIISTTLKNSLHKMRLERNSVHLIARSHSAYIGTSRRLYKIFNDTINETRNWKTLNP